MSSLYEKLGGAPAVEAAVDLFYRKVLTDELLMPFFDDVDMDRQIDKQRAFLTYAFGGPANYTGRDLRTAHAALVERGITDRHFDAVVGHLGSTLAELGVPESLIREAATVANSVREDVLGRSQAA